MAGDHSSVMGDWAQASTWDLRSPLQFLFFGASGYSVLKSLGNVFVAVDPRTSEKKRLDGRQKVTANFLAALIFGGLGLGASLLPKGNK